ncbi:unnamed protein product [Caenorhabditis nigoni]
MLETEIPLAKDESGAIFIDRDPKYFRLILNYLRDGVVEMPESSEDVREIKKEAEYYLLDGLVKMCIPKPEPQKLPFFFRNDEDMARAVSSSTKKLVCSVFFARNQEEANLREAVKNIMKYGLKIDFFFKEATFTGLSYYNLFNKVNNTFFEDTSYNGSLDDFIKKSVPDIYNP